MRKNPIPPSVAKARIAAKGQKAKESVDWLSWADKDYIAARQLILGKFMVQGTCLANTAIEKYLKAVLSISGERIPRSHNPFDIYQQIESNSRFRLNDDFLALLVKAYKLRYPDELKPGFNIVLGQALILFALDDSVKQINSCFVLSKPDGTPVIRLLDHLIEQKDPRILANNVALQTITKEQLLGQPSYVYEMRVFNNKSHMEAEYLTAKIDDPSFKKEALLQKSDKEFQLSSLPSQ